MILIKEEWSLWLAFVRFSDGIGGKERPVVVLDDQIILCVCMGVTSKEKRYRHGYKLKHWKHAGLKAESWVRYEYIKLEPDEFIHRIGMLHPDDIRGIENWMKDLMQGHSKYRPD